jgi:putative oxidoreductase
MEAVMRRNLPMLLIRVMVGLVFVTEGILKFVRPQELGVGRFTAIGLPSPELLAPLVAVIEIVGGLAVVAGFYAGDAAMALLAVIVVALVTTKLPILIGRPLGPFALNKLAHYGVTSFLHEARVDFCMLLGTVAVLLDAGLKVGRRRPWYQSKGL